MDIFAKAIPKELLLTEKETRLTERRQVAPRREGLDHFSLPVVMERIAYLRKLAKLSDGSASETIKEYPQHAIMLLYRGRSGVAELHGNFADLFLVLEGRAALVTGGSIANAKKIAPGEVRGDAIEDGARQELRGGDVAHVAAGVPHQMLISGEQSIACLVVKIRQEAEQ